jgi:predicted nicotinamide N-methyase
LKKLVLSEKFETSQTRLELDGHSIELTVLTNLDALFDQLIAKGPDHEDVRDERIPYWAELWPAAIALSRYLLETYPSLEGKNVLELGCGLGLPGIVAGLLGAEVTLTDYLPEPLDFARRNWEQNLSRPARFELLDWRNPQPALAADLVLASDIAYEKRAFPFLHHAFQTLCRPGGTILASDPSRSASPELFQSLLPAQGFLIQTFPYREARNGHVFQIQVHAIRLPR